MRKTLVVLFGIKARQGKDTCVQTIIDAYKDKYDIRRYAFADELKKELQGQDQLAMCAQYGVGYNFSAPMDDPLCPPPHGKQAALQQAYGQAKRAIDSYYWIKKVAAAIEQDKPQIALISDMRYRNERLWGLSIGGRTVKVTRQGFVDLTRDTRHPSETELDGYEFHYEITVQDGQLDELKQDALTVFADILNEYQPKQEPLDHVLTIDHTKATSQLAG